MQFYTRLSYSFFILSIDNLACGKLLVKLNLARHVVIKCTGHRGAGVF